MYAQKIITHLCNVLLNSHLNTAYSFTHSIRSAFKNVSLLLPYDCIIFVITGNVHQHSNGSVGSMVANQRDGGDSLVVVTTLVTA